MKEIAELEKPDLLFVSHNWHMKLLIGWSNVA